MSLFKKILLGGTLVVLLTALIAALVVSSQAFQDHVKQQIVMRLEAASGGRVSVESLQLNLFPLKAELAGLTIQRRDRTAQQPFLKVRKIEAYLYWSSPLGIFRLKTLTVDELECQVLVHPDGTSNVPEPGPAADGADLFRFVVDAFEVRQGALLFNAERSSFSTRVENLAVSARYQAAKGYQALLKYEAGSIRFGKLVWDYGLDLEAELQQDQIRVGRLVASTRRSKLQAQGLIRNLSDPAAEFNYSGALQIAEAKAVLPQLRELSGEVRISGTLSASRRQWRAVGMLEAARLSLNATRVERFTSQYSLTPEQLQFDKVQFVGLHGRVGGRFTVGSPFGQRRYAADLQMTEVGLLDLSALAALERAQFAGKLAGTIKATWQESWKNLAGEGRLTISDSPTEPREHQLEGKSLPISGQLNFSLSEWSSQFRNSFLKLGETLVQFSGTLAANDASTLRFEVHSESLSDLAFLMPDLDGRANVVGTVEGTPSQPRIRGSFIAERVSYQKFRVDEAQGRFEGDRRVIDLSKVDLVRGGARVGGRGKIFLDPVRFVPTGDVHLLADFRDVPAEDLYAMLGESYPVSGIFSANLMATGQLSHLVLEGHVQAQNGLFLGQPYKSARADIQYRDAVLSLQNISANQWNGQMRGEAVLRLKEQQVQATMHGTGILLDQISWMQFSGSSVSGQLRKLDLKVAGPYRRPALDGELEVVDLRLAGERVGDFRVRLETEKQLLRFQTDSLTAETDLKGSGSVRLDENLDCIAQLAFRNFVLSPYVRRMLPAAPAQLSSRAEGQVVLTGPLRYPEKLIITGRLQSMEINFREAQLKTSRPFELDVRNEQVNIKDASFVGKGTMLNLNGLVDLTQLRRLQLTLRGEMDLALLNEFVKKLSASGSAVLNASVRGTLTEPRIQGQARINSGQFAYEGLPNSFSEVSGNFFFDENQVKIDNLSGSSGGGKVQASGDLVFGQEQIRLMNLRIEGREVRIRYPEGMRNVVDADLTLRGSQRAQVLSGSIRILSASFQKGYDPITQFLEERATHPTWQGVQQLGGTLSLDLTITGDRNIKLDTPLIKMTSRADLRVKGTAASPLVTGSIEASGGELYFQGARYRITRGRLDFLNPVRIDPRIDLEAETDLRDYRIVLTINGTADKFRADLRSDPPMPTVDLFGLVSAGGTGGGLAPGAYRPYATSGRQQENSAAAASALLSEGLSMKVGSGVKRLFGIDRFRVDPFLVGNERDPSPRVTFGQQITKDFSITYSTSVSSNEQQIILLEYQLNDSTSIIASRDAEGSFGLDVRFRKRLRQRNR